MRQMVKKKERWDNVKQRTQPIKPHSLLNLKLA